MFPLKGTEDPTEPGRIKPKPQGDYVAISDVMLQMGKLRHIFYHRLDKFASTLRSSVPIAQRPLSLVVHE